MPSKATTQGAHSLMTCSIHDSTVFRSADKSSNVRVSQSRTSAVLMRRPSHPVFGLFMSEG